MEKKFDPRGKERKRTNRKKWYKAVCSLAAAVVVCTVYTLMLPALTLDEKSAGDVVTISESSVATSEAPAAESSKSDNGSENQNDTAADSSADSSHAATESGPAAAAPSDDRAPSTTNPTTEGEHNAPVTLPTEETNSGAITGSSESHDEVTSPDTDDQEKIKDEENNGSPAADKEETDKEEADNSGSSTDADTEEDDSEKSDDTADVEDASYWETTIPDLSDCETWAEKLLAVAGSQLGYHESILNFRVDNDGNHKGYTRYGEWYGNPYGDWCAMFVSFCLKYAGIDQEAIPQNANCSDWVTNLKKMEIYEDADLYVPEAGDIVFFDQSDADRPNHVGIISEVTYGTKTVIRHITKDGSAIESGAMNALKYINEATSDDASGDELRTEEVEVPVAESIKVIEGNSSDQVQYVDYDLSNEKILGYISLTNAKNVYEGIEEQKPVEEQKIEPLKYEGSDYVIKVEYTEEAQLPEGVHLEAEELQEGTEAYEDYYNRTVEKLIEDSSAENEDALGISFARFFDLKFITADGEEIEPAAPVSVKIRYTDRVEVNDDQTATVVHFAKTTATAETDDSWTSNSDISTFSMNAPAAIAVDSSNAQQSPAEANSTEGTSEIVEVPEIIEPEAVENSTFEFEQGSFSVTATIIQNSQNYDFVNGAQYIIYTDSNKALKHNSNDELEVTDITAPNGDVTYNDGYFDSSLLWTYEDGKFYYLKGDAKNYLNIKYEEKWIPGGWFDGHWEGSYAVTITTSQASKFSVENGIIKGSSNGETKYIKLNSNLLECRDTASDATKFKFAKIQTEYIPQGHATSGNISHTKYVKKYDDNTYDLTLDVSAGIGSKTAPAMLDVVFVLDVSESMTGDKMPDSDGQRRNTFTVAKNTINTIASNLNNNEKLNVRYSLVTFSGLNSNYGSNTPYDDAKSYDWGNMSTLMNRVNDAEAKGGTNYQAGLLNANSLIDSARDGARTAVIFISDGNAGYYYDSEGMTNGTGDPGSGVYAQVGEQNPPKYYYYDPIAMANAQIEIHKMKANYFCAVGIGSDSSKYDKLELLIKDEEFPKKGMTIKKDYRSYLFGGGEWRITETFSQNYNIPESLITKYAAAKNSNSINALLNQIDSDMTSISAKDVTVYDTLSEYAKFTQGAVPHITITDNSKSEGEKGYIIAEGDHSVEIEGKYITANINPDTGTLMMDFPDDYELPSNYKFSVTVRIEPTENAIQLGEANYNSKGEAGTGETSVDQLGFRSNADIDGHSAAKVILYYGSEKKTEYYNHPVIQVPAGYELPETGGPGTTLLYLLGAMLITAPLTITFIKRRRKENEEN